MKEKYSIKLYSIILFRLLISQPSSADRISGIEKCFKKVAKFVWCCRKVINRKATSIYLLSFRTYYVLRKDLLKRFELIKDQFSIYKFPINFICYVVIKKAKAKVPNVPKEKKEKLKIYWMQQPEKSCFVCFPQQT